MAIKDKESMLLVNEEGIPQILKQLKQWVLWKAEFNEKTQTFDKVPYQANGVYKASTTKKTSWNTFKKVYEAYENGLGDGIGFVLHEQDPFACVDIDNIEDIDNLPELAQEIIELSYAEVSPSGKGIHVWIRHNHNKEKHMNKNTKLGYELYSTVRFITFTGESLNDLPINEGEEIEQFIDKVFKREEEKPSETSQNRSEYGTAALSEEKIIKIALKSKNGERFKLFMYGGWEQFYNSQSEADMAFCNDLAFWTNCDYHMMDNIFRQSSLYRDKWDRKQNSTTYGDETLQKAIADCTNTFQVDNNPYFFINEASDSFVFPKGYISKNGCLYKQVEDKKTGEVEECMICRQTPVITRSFMNVEYPQLYHEVSWVDRGKNYSETVPAGQLATRKKLLDLADNSLAVADWNAAELIRYFDLLNMVNSREREHLVERLGHIKKAFIHPLITEGVTILPPDIGERQQLEAFQVLGTTAEWLTNVLEPIKKHPKALLMVLASFTSVLLQELKLQPFIVDLSGTTSMGKTTVLKVAASVWGNEHLVNEWNLTKVAAERKASFLNSFPLILDDTRKADEKQLQGFVYNFSGGRSKGRGSINGSQREFTWNNLLLSTGEASLSTYAEGAGGVAARILPITGLPFKNANYEFFNNLYSAIDKYYGSVGIDFLKNWECVRKDALPRYQEISSSLQRTAQGNEVVARIARHYAAIVFTGELLNKFFNVGIDLKSLFLLFGELNEDNKAVDKPKQLLENILNDLDANRSSIYYDCEPNNEIKAIYKHDTLYLLLNYLKQSLKVEEKTIRSEWLRRGIVVGNENNGKKVDYKLIKHKGKSFRCVAINPKMLDELGFDFKYEPQYQKR